MPPRAAARDGIASETTVPGKLAMIVGPMRSNKTAELLRRIETRYLLDPALDDAALSPLIEDVARIPPCAGFTIDKRGRLYFSSFTQNAMLVMGEDRALRSFVADPRISFEHLVFLVCALAGGEELQLAACEVCGALTVVDRFSFKARHCPHCAGRVD